MNWFLFSCITGEVAIEGGIQFALDSDLTAEPPEFTLTCISIEGPATSVVWTRDSTTVITEGTETVLNDQMAARYTHTLTVTGRLGGDYVCNVSNSISSILSRELNIKGVYTKPERKKNQKEMFFNAGIYFSPIVASPPTNLMVAQETGTSFRLTWTPPSPLGDTTGYTVLYSATGSSSSGGSVEISGGSSDSLALTGLTSGVNYTVSLIARSQHIPSAAVTAPVEPSEAETLQYIP